MEHDVRKLIAEVLEKGCLMSLGTVDEGGVWVADVSYVSDDDFNIYWLSQPDVRHSRAIAAEPRVAATITVNRPGGHDEGIQISGIVEKLDGQRLDLEQAYAWKRKKKMPLAAGEIAQDRPWYRLKPALIELIHEERFGFEKQALELDLEARGLNK
jgi:uncharacterized protein